MARVNDPGLGVPPGVMTDPDLTNLTYRCSRGCSSSWRSSTRVPPRVTQPTRRCGSSKSSRVTRSCGAGESVFRWCRCVHLRRPDHRPDLADLPEELRHQGGAEDHDRSVRGHGGGRLPRGADLRDARARARPAIRGKSPKRRCHGTTPPGSASWRSLSPLRSCCASSGLAGLPMLKMMGGGSQAAGFGSAERPAVAHQHAGTPRLIAVDRGLPGTTDAAVRGPRSCLNEAGGWQARPRLWWRGSSGSSASWRVEPFRGFEGRTHPEIARRVGVRATR